jgi:hypothetical protein
VLPRIDFREHGSMKALAAASHATHEQMLQSQSLGPHHSSQSHEQLLLLGMCK